MIVILWAAILTNVHARPVDKMSSLFLEDLKTLERRMKNTGKDGIEMIYLSNAEMISRTIQVESVDVSLIGNRTILEYNVEERRSDIYDESEGRKFMFSVWNSSFRVSGVRALCMSNETGLCVVSSSKVYLWLSSVISDGLHSPLVMRCSGDGMCGSSSSIVVSQCTHESPRHFVAPFVDVCHSRNDDEISGSERESEHIGGSESISVVGRGISMKSQTLWMGTGPLFSFGMASNENRDFRSALVGWMDTGMEFCSLVNMSSRSDRVGDFGKSGKGFGNVVQRIVGSSICLSSNHDRGTGMLDVNLGGSLRCVNTSFFSCVREGNSETAKSESFTEFVQGDRFKIGYGSSIKSVSYTLCSFNEMTTSDGDGLGAAAISLYWTLASLTIDLCYFHKCSVTAENDDGGAINVHYSSSDNYPVEISRSSFTECKTVELIGNYGGGLLVMSSSQLTMDRCFFETCSAQCGGAVSSFNSPFTLSNCALVLCKAAEYGGALSIERNPSIDFSFLQFRECACSDRPSSKDIIFLLMSSPIANSDTFKFCDSTSGSPNVNFAIGNINDSTLVPQLTEEEKTDISSFEVSMGEDTATITIRTTKEVKGTMGVLLEGSTVPRLVHIEFGTADIKSSTGTVEVSIGLEELEGTSDASFELTGCFLKTGTYSMKVKDSENNDFAISLSLSSGSLTGTSPVSSTDSTKLKYEEEYEVVEVLCDSQPLILATSFSFSIPYPPATLTGIEQTDGSDSMTIGFVGTGFVASGYKVRVTEVGVEEPSTLTVDLLPSSESRLTEWTAKLYPFSKADLKYGTEYKVSSFVSLDGKQIKAEVSVEGRVMSVVETYTLHLNETGTQTPAKMNMSFSSATNGNGTALLFSLIDSEIELKYDTNYTVVNVTDSSNDAVLFASGLTFKTDAEPTRLVSFSVVDATHCFVDFPVSSSESEDFLAFGKEYTVSIKTGETASFIVNDGITARIPFPPRLLSASFAFTNTLLTSCSVSFIGSDLPVVKDFRVTLSPSLSFVIGVVDAEHAESSRLRIGWPDSLEFSRNYTISSIVGLDEDDGVILFDPSLSFETKPGPSKMTLFVDSSSGSSEWFCGEESLPCSMIEAAWWIVDGIGVSKVTLDIVHNTTQSKQIVISKGMEVGVKSGETTKPELFLSALPTLEEEEGMISITEASLLLNHVDVVLASSSSLIFVVVVNGTLTLQLCSIVGSSLSPSPTLNSEPFSCSWKSGAFVLKNSKTKLVSSSFSLLSSGAVWMEGGNLSIVSSSFFDNSPHDALFPSARRNIACSSGGTMMIGSLSGGDGTPTSPSPWISQNDCSLEGLESIRSAPLFVPTLSSSESSSEFSKKNKTFSMWIVGSTLIPLEERDSHLRFDLVVFSLFSGFVTGMAWLSLVWITLKTDIGLTSSISERRSQSVKENMKWWLPLVIALCVLVLLLMIVVFVCWRRRGQAEKKKSLTADPEPQEMEIEKIDARIELEQKMEETIIENSVDQLIKMNQTARPQPVRGSEKTEELPVETHQFVEVLGECGEVGVVDCLKADTLFDILHRQEKQRSFDKRTMSVRVAKILERIWKEHKNSGIVTHFSPHCVLVNNSSVLLRLAPIEERIEETEVKNENEIPEQEQEQPPECEQSFFGERLSAPTGKAAEGLRWRAPEIGAWNGEKIDGESALVFSLGLVLWEIWTGEVPWKEMDEANAGRQNEGGVQPNTKLVLDEGIRTLISQSLSLDPKERPSLKSVVGVLCSVDAADEDPGNRKASAQLDIRS
ncbi:hypothetical protein BLNAU_10998 [Blattamonas nauphoetae]|uniref:Protein kinase domain-containing protein n=1 Tax=Blattamonas nauphoetae TaxID=2049346 RepID=A0ABQ9XR27_9EUKA|nr:hypothetical protein BLNAU_10998 [Blattamonas nauphoetae]